MTRPKKATVDFFPHYCNHKKTMFIIEGRYGNDGYAAWFKILEVLGISEGHYINCNDYSSYAFLIAKTNLQEDRFLEIVNLLAEINAIDADLWTKKKIIWSQNFVDNLDEVYSRRKIEKPSIETIGVDLSKENDDEFNKKLWCRSATNMAIKQGLLTKGDCQTCGSDIDIEAHHEDYSDPFNVVWYCKTHHIEYHKTHSMGKMSTENPLNRKDDHINPQSKVEYSRVEKDSCASDNALVPKNSRNGFDQFWQAYPKKKGKGAAEKAFLTVKKQPDFNLQAIIFALEHQKKTHDWIKDGGQFIPFPATWLNQKRWLDEVVNNKSNNKLTGLPPEIAAKIIPY
jgi:hypothetical protein